MSCQTPTKTLITNQQIQNKYLRIRNTVHNQGHVHFSCTDPDLLLKLHLTFEKKDTANNRLKFLSFLCYICFNAQDTCFFSNTEF